MDDRGFISWILHGTNRDEWELFLQEHPEFSETVTRAKELIAALDPGDELLPGPEAVQIWKTIETFHEENNRRKGKKIRTAWFIRIAATFLILITVGIIALSIFNRDAEPYRFATDESQIESGDARLVLSTGENIRLKNENSKITVEEGKALYIENDSTVNLGNEKTGTDGKDAMNEVIVPFGKKSRILLSDGTKVCLNAGTRFAFPSAFKGKNREVFLEGEAYFEVSKSERSFYVNTPDIKVKVFGTRFNVSAYKSDKRVETLLLEGKVSVSANTGFGLMNREIILEPFQKASYIKETHETLITPEPEADIYISWTEGWFHFSKENISNVMKKLERYYNVKVVYDQSFYEQELISGKLDLKESLDEVMLVLTNVAPIIYRIDGNVIRIDRKIEGLPMIR